jgi:cell shape-determining protein MreC
MSWSPEDIMMGLYIAVAVMLIVVLYHVIFIVVDLRKMMKRFDSLTAEVETIVMKPLSMADKGLEWMIQFFQEKAEQRGNAGKKHIED